MSVPIESQMARLRQLGAPELLVVGPAGEATEAVLEARFTVGGREVGLRPPLDWRQDPFGSRSWRYSLHTLQWLAPVLARHAADGDESYLKVARDLALDWVRQHPGDARPAGSSEFAWYDMAVGLRAPHLAYILRACLHAGAIDAGDACTLLTAVEDHGRELASAENYAAGHNHGLFQDEGLYLIARQVPVLSQAAAWTHLATGRLRETLRQTIDFEEGAHLEHSSGYQFAIVNMVARLRRSLAGDADLEALHARLRATAAWHVTPAERIVQLGDTDDVPAPRWARERARELAGLHVLRTAGQAFVRRGDSYLALTAAYHGRGHKQSDETGFVLVEAGRTVFGDAGRWGYYEREPDRVYARSSHAHNVLVVDGEDFPWRGEEPYGSGLEAAVSGDGWYAVAARNRLLARRGVAHHRLLLYRPGVMLVVVDHVASDVEHEYARRFHFGPGLAASVEDGRVTASEEEGGGIVATLTDRSPGTSIELSRGGTDPERLGWWYPADRERVAIATATARGRASTATFAAVVALREDAPTDASAAIEPSGARVALSDGRVLLVVLDGARASISEGRAR